MTSPGLTGEVVQATTWDEYIGQEKLKERLLIHINAAAKEERQLDHILLVGPPGTGKTTLAGLIADELNEPFFAFKMPIKERQLTYFIQEWAGGILLLDELHAAPKAFQEMLLTAIQGGYIQSPDGLITKTGHVTFLAATTEPEKLITPLWDRFFIKPAFADYSDDEMRRILQGMAIKAKVTLSEEVAQGLARAGGGTPRIAGSLVLAARDLQTVGQEVTVESVLDLAGIDADGLSDRHMAYLRTLKQLGCIAGLANICTMLQLSQTTVEGLERLLIQRGFVQLTSKGRSMTATALAKLPNQNAMVAQARRRRIS